MLQHVAVESGEVFGHNHVILQLDLQREADCCIQLDKLVSQETSFNESSWSRDLFLVIKYLRIEHFYFLTLRKGLGVVSDDILPCRL